MFFNQILNRIVEFKTPLSLQDTIRIIIDGMGEKILPHLIKQAEENVKLRREIISRYFKKDNEWVGYSQTVLKELKNFQKIA